MDPISRQPTSEATTVELAHMLDAAARRIADEGTSAAGGLLHAMSKVTEQTAPGAAAALVDRNGTEISRLRAFGLLHSHLLNALGPREHAWLLGLVGDAGRLGHPQRVA
jgi:hypothetical protein